MPTVTYVSAAGNETRIDAAVGTTVMAAAVQNRVRGIVGECGGTCSCATCHVFIINAPADLPPMSDDEDEMLDGAASERAPHSRLGCQIPITSALDGLVVRMPESQL